jgi:hypothetical protein
MKIPTTKPKYQKATRRPKQINGNKQQFDLKIHNLTDIFFFFLVAPTLGSFLPLLEHRAEFPQFLDQGQSVGLLGRVISLTHI